MATFNLKASRESINLTQQAVADKLGVSRETVNRWETGKTPMPVKKQKAFLEVFDLHDITTQDVGTNEKDHGTDLRPRKPPVWWTSPIGLYTSDLWTEEDYDVFCQHYLKELASMGQKTHHLDFVMAFYQRMQREHDVRVVMLKFESLGFVRISPDGTKYFRLNHEVWEDRQHQRTDADGLC
ncbi:MAG: helix-turn-helix transcriptional regulator [Chromatiaceae bacterium]|nr:helix-turn-helix transcriptional regulator [Chromatiaceae bacterium]